MYSVEKGNAKYSLINKIKANFLSKLFILMLFWLHFTISDEKQSIHTKVKNS